MDMQMHEIYSEQIAQQLIQKAYIPLQGEVTFEDVKNGYERYFKNPNKGTIVEYICLILFHNLCWKAAAVKFHIALFS